MGEHATQKDIGEVERTHRGVRLRDTAAHTTEETSCRGADTQTNRRSLNLGRGEEQDTTLRRCFDPGLCVARQKRYEASRERGAHPWNQTLVETEESASTPHRRHGLNHSLRPVGRHLGLEHFERLSERRDLAIIAYLDPWTA